VSFALALLVAGVSGFIALSYEIVWYRVIAFESWGLPGAFGLLLAAYLFGIAFGSRVAGRFCKDDALAGDKRQLRSLAAFALVANVVAWAVVPFFARTAKYAAFTTPEIAGLAKMPVPSWMLGLVLVLVAAGLLGAILPLVCHFAIAPDDRAGQRLSYVYLANIVGSAAGSLITGFVFFDVWPLQTTGLVVALVGLALVGLLVVLADLKGVARMRWAAAVAVAGGLLVVGTPRAYDRLWERLLYKQKIADDTKFAEIIETKSGVIAVTQDGTVYGGGAYDGRFNTSIRWDRNGIMRAYGIGAMHPAPKKILMIGLASGSWATVIQNLPGLGHLTIVEINPGYLKLVANHKEVAPILTDPKVDIVIDDGRRWLNRHPSERFDVIVMNTTWHWRAHITDLLSVEFMNLARAHLEPGGLFYFNTTSSEDVQKTAATVFPHALRVRNFMAVSDTPLVFDKERWRKTLADFAIGGEPTIDRSTDDGQKLFEELVTYADTINEAPTDEGLESRDAVLARTQAATVVTDDNMFAEWRAVLRVAEPP
jgi:spermidine synthase